MRERVLEMAETKIEIEALITAPSEKVWSYWTKPEHITKWNFASDDWQAILNNFKKYAEAH